MKKIRRIRLHVHRLYCVMGHVDHGKTSLVDCDYVSTRVTDCQAGGVGILPSICCLSVVSINGQRSRSWILLVMRHLPQCVWRGCKFYRYLTWSSLGQGALFSSDYLRQSTMQRPPGVEIICCCQQDSISRVQTFEKVKQELSE